LDYAPEIIDQLGQGRGVDWWTLGVLIYELLTGYAPFECDEAIQTYRRILKVDINFATTMPCCEQACGVTLDPAKTARLDKLELPW
jgi:serine/threonine protein kinase